MTTIINVDKRPKQLFRYSKRKWLNDTLKRGVFKINSASNIKKLENDIRRGDDEMRVEFNIPKDQATIKLLTNNQPIIPTSDIKILDEISTDYYLLCFSSQKKSFLFDEFVGSEACLVIHDTTELNNRILSATEKKLPDFVGIDAPVTYGRSSQWGATFSKPLDYIFQSEWRFSWVPLKGAKHNLDNLFIEIGNIENIAEIIDKF